MKFVFDQYEIDEPLRELRFAGEPRHLEPQAFDLLVFLVQNRDRVVPKHEIVDSIWGDQFVSESALTTRIKQIRKMVGDDGTRQSVIKTVHGKGYRFVADLSEVADAKSTTALPSTTTSLRLTMRSIDRRPGEKISYASLGQGPPLIFMPGWISNLASFADGTDPRSVLVAELAQHFTVTIFDRFGTGRSTSDDPDTSLEGSADEIRALVADTTEPVVLFASSAAGPPAILAAVNNDKIAAVVLMCTYASGPQLFTNASNNAAVLDLVRQSWGLGSRILADMIVPGIDAMTRSRFARFQRRAATGEVAAAYLEELYRADVGDQLAKINQTCLVLHYRDDPAIPSEGSHQLAMGIPNAELVLIDGPFHTPPPEKAPEITQQVVEFVSRL